MDKKIKLKVKATNEEVELVRVAKEQGRLLKVKVEGKKNRYKKIPQDLFFSKDSKGRNRIFLESEITLL